MFEIPQIIGYIAMAICILSFQAKTQKGVVLLQCFSTCLFATHFFLIKAYSGAILNFICLIRSIIYTQRQDKKWAQSKIWIGVFIFLTFVSYFLTVFVLTPADKRVLTLFLVELLPTMGNVVTTFSTRMENAKLVRRYSLVASPLWLSYNIINGSIGGTITETFSIISIFIGMLRLDFKKEK